MTTAKVWNSGTTEAPVFNFELPSGARGAKGEPGDLLGSVVQDWTGAVTLQDYPQTYHATLKGNVTAITLPPVPVTRTSGTVTIIATQDATGGRTIVWPAAVLWPEGVKPQPSQGAATISMFHLIWSGTQWLGVCGGKSFA